MFQHNPTRSLEWQDASEENEQAETVADQDPTEDEGEPPVALETVSAEPASDTAETVEEADPSDADDQDMSTVTPFILHSAPDPEVDQERQPQNTEVADLLADNTVALDEEALRDLVGEMVRRELQGALGERITRNVRKLVRREIHRAMVAREFE